MKDVKFVLGECTKSNTKYYFQYNNKVYFIIEKSPTQEVVLDRITNIRNAYDKWKNIKADSDEKEKKANDDQSEEKIEKDYSYTSIVFEYESDITMNPKPSRDRLPKEKFKFEKITLDRNEEKFEKFEKYDKFEKMEKKRQSRKNDFDKKNKDDKHKNYKKNNNSRYDKNNSYNRRNEHKGDRQNHNS